MNRLQNIVSKYNDVDPEEHRLLKLKLEEKSAAAATFEKREADLLSKYKETTDESKQREADLQSKVQEISEELAVAKTRSTVSTPTKPILKRRI